MTSTKPTYLEFVRKVLEGEIDLPNSSALKAEIIKNDGPSLFQLSREDEIKSAYFTAKSLILYVGTFILANWFFHEKHYFLFALSIIYQGSNFFSMESIIHDALHSNLFKNPKACFWVGYLLSPLLFMGFLRWKKAHLDHHRYSQTIQDPKGNISGTKTNEVTFFDKLVRDLLLEKIYKNIPTRFLKFLTILCIFFWLSFPFLMSGTNFCINRLRFDAKEDLPQIGLNILLHLNILHFFSLQGELVFILTMFAGYMLTAINFTQHGLSLSIRPVNFNHPVLLSLNVTNLDLGWFYNRKGLGFYDCHLEHHLFPDLTAQKLYKIKEALKKTSVGNYSMATRKFHLDYVEEGFVGFTPDDIMEINGKRFYAIREALTTRTDW
jgi:fatty acid desaturase